MAGGASFWMLFQGRGKIQSLALSLPLRSSWARYRPTRLPKPLPLRPAYPHGVGEIPAFLWGRGSIGKSKAFLEGPQRIEAARSGPGGSPPCTPAPPGCTICWVTSGHRYRTWHDGAKPGRWPKAPRARIRQKPIRRLGIQRCDPRAVLPRALEVQCHHPISKRCSRSMPKGGRRMYRHNLSGPAGRLNLPGRRYAG